MSLTPDDLTGQALGLHATGMMAFQGVGAAAAGGLAQLTGPATAMTVMASGSVAVTLVTAGLGARPGPARTLRAAYADNAGRPSGLRGGEKTP
uniref:hypothetical protein n=1 Tax=Streptomyces broussonetiae TaxID=2686304 RepID=UPI0035D8506D